MRGNAKPSDVSGHQRAATFHPRSQFNPYRAIVLTVLGLVGLLLVIAFAWGAATFLLAMPSVEQDGSGPRAPIAASQSDETTTSDQHPEPPPQIPSRNALWAINQTKKLLSGKPDDIRSLAEQATALAIVDGDEFETRLLMDLTDDEFEFIWNQVRGEFDTEWVRGYMVHHSRSAYVHTLLRLYVNDRAPHLNHETPAVASEWPAWLEQHAKTLGW